MTTSELNEDKSQEAEGVAQPLDGKALNTENSTSQPASELLEQPMDGAASPSQGKLASFISKFKPRIPFGKTSSLAKSEEQQFYGHLRDQKKLDLGWIGFVIGHGVEKLGNIAFISILLCFGIIIGLIWWPVADDKPFREKTASTLFSIITLALGYLFGKTTSNGAEKDKNQ